MFITDMVRNIGWLARRSKTVQQHNSVMPVDAVDALQPVHPKRDREARQDLIVIVAHGPAAGAAAADERAVAEGATLAGAASAPESGPEYNASGELDKPPRIDVKV